MNSTLFTDFLETSVTVTLLLWQNILRSIQGSGFECYKIYQNCFVYPKKGGL